MKKTFLTLAATAAMVFGIAGQAAALAITPASGVLNTSRWEGNATGQPEIDAAIAGILGTAVELYKSDVSGGSGVGSDSGSLAGSYNTVFSNTPADPSNATITYVPFGNIVGSPAYLLVKDGNQVPAWYLFRLSGLNNIFGGTGWNGTDTLELSGFWPNQGAISHVTLYGTSAPPPTGVPQTPEPATLALFGAALALVGARLRRKN